MYAYDYKGQVATSAIPPKSGDFIIVANPPKDNLFRKAQRIIAGEYVVDLAEAKSIAHTRRRAKRKKVFAPHRLITSKHAQGIPLGNNENNTEALNAMTTYKTNVDDVLQTNIDAAIDEAELRLLIETEEL